MKLPVAALLALLLTIVLAAPAPAQDAGRTVTVNGIDLHFRQRGSGPPLLLLHGFGACGADWGPIADELAANYRLVIPDLRGHGRSTNPSNAFTMRQSGEDIAALLDHLGLERVDAIGISAGGMTLLHLAARQPERIGAMILVGAATHFPDQARAIMRSISFETMPPFLQEMYRSCAARGDAQVRQLLGQFAGFQHSRDDMNFTAEQLRLLKPRTLIVHGDRDEFFPVDIPVAMYRAIPGAALWIVPGGDHVPVFGSRMPEFVRVVRDFLSLRSE